MRVFDGEDKDLVFSSLLLPGVTLLDSWIRDFEKIKQAFHDKKFGRRRITKGQLQLRANFHDAEKVLYKRVIERRKKGRRVSTTFVCIQMSLIVKKMYIDEEGMDGQSANAWQYELTSEQVEKKKELANAFKATRHWRIRFYNRYKLVHRKRTIKKQRPIAERIVVWGQQHCEVRLHSSKHVLPYFSIKFYFQML